MDNKLICVKCGKRLYQRSQKYICEVCGALYPIIDNIPSFVENGHIGDGFEAEMLDVLAEVEKDHFWHRGRREIIYQMIRKYSEKTSKKELTMLELGCGNGNIVCYLKRKGIDISGADISIIGLKSCKKETNVPFYQVDILKTPFYPGSFSIVGLFDIIEHLDDDVTALKEAYRICKKNGCVIITVPANESLWSYFDIISGHKRRYSKKDLISKVKATGFHIEKVSFFMFFLLPFFAVIRQFKFFGTSRNKKASQLSELKVIPVVNEIFLMFFILESLILKKVNLPYGSSLICVARK